ncbi:hypothetical protein PHLCEN_2v2538 [Hermanssonia centrifuga]|uniref:Transcription activator of gluconeogenesis ERT1 n=1 Tax=Hermanssonia centrifuga TaxID=98765 RepID=A0A2R6RLK6_9APHY|nr:hypothetical protein PHLCEN_2v2538 [Hermanssonia centrifuga]
MADANQDNEEQGSASPSDTQSTMTMHPVTYSGMPMHMYPFPPGLVQPQPARTKRRQVKNACTNCQKACKKCDDARPCLRCVKYGIAEECIDSQRKERQKGIKRGPYKKRDGKDRASSGNVEQQIDLGVQPGISIPAAIAATAAGPQMPYMTPVGYPGFFGQYSALPAAKPGEAPTAYPYPTQYYITPIPMPPPQGTGQDGEAAQYAGFYPAITFAPYAPQPYATPYMMQAPRPIGDGQQFQQLPQMAMAQPLQYAAFPQHYPKPPSRDVPHEPLPQMMDPTGRREMRMDPYGSRMGESVAGAHGKTQ